MPRVDWSFFLHVIAMLLLQESYCTDLELWRQSCPFSTFCTMTSVAELTSIDDTMQPCCTHCSCDADCWVINNCCPDATYERPVDSRNATCTGMFVQNEFATTSSLFSSHYHVIDFCPRDNKSNDQFVDKCERRFHDNADFNGVVAVSDTKNRIYKNKYCALCHGVYDVVGWSLRMLFCKDDLNLKGISATRYIPAVLENCVLESIPPSEMVRDASTSMFCGPSLVAECSASTPGEESPTAEIIDGCLNGPDLPFLLIEYDDQGVLFKNVLCYLCNAAEMKHTCPATGVTTQNNDYGVSYDMLLNVDLGDTIQTMMTAERMSLKCNETEIYDGVKDRCIQMFCPLYHVVFYGICLKMGVSEDSSTVILIQYKPKEGIYFIDDIEPYEKEAGLLYMNDILERYQLEGCHVTEFFLGAIVKSSNGVLAYVLVTIDVKFNDTCQMGDIAEAIRGPLSRPDNITLPINGFDVELTGNVHFYKDADESSIAYYNPEIYTERYLVSEFTNEISVTTGPERDFFLCPHVIVNIEEYNSIISDVFGDGHARGLTEITESTRVEHGFYTLTNETIAVCVDTYFEMYQSNGANSNAVCSIMYLAELLLLKTLIMRFFNLG